MINTKSIFLLVILFLSIFRLTAQSKFSLADLKRCWQLKDMVYEETGGKYFRATDKESLRNVYKEIDKLEKTIISEKSFSNKAEHFFPFALIAGIALLLEFLFRYLIIRAQP